MSLASFTRPSKGIQWIAKKIAPPRNGWRMVLVALFLLIFFNRPFAAIPIYAAGVRAMENTATHISNATYLKRNPILNPVLKATGKLEAPVE